jgi:hypothetical protein
VTVTPDVLALARRMRAVVDSTVDEATRDLVGAWVDAWDELKVEWQVAITDLVNSSTDGQWPTRSQILRGERAMRALDLTEARLDDLGQLAGVRVLRDVPTLTGEAAVWQARLIGAQYPDVSPGEVVSGAAFNRVDPAALDAIVARTTQQVNALTAPLSREATSALTSSLIRGVALGDNPRAAAARMLRSVESGFNGGLTRALVIARTEMLDAHRGGAWAQDQANADVLTGWQWVATLDVRTCPSCLAQHGRQHPVDVPGPIDHQQGRCARIPLTKTWRELGFDLDDPPSAVPDAQAWFNDLSAEKQLQVMGPTRLRLLDDGQISWADLSTLRSTPGWRDSMTVTPVRDLIA